MTITPPILWLYLDEQLPPEQMIWVEQRLREDPKLLQECRKIAKQRENGEHSVASIWRRFRVSCLSRDELACYVMQRGDPALLRYIVFHLEVYECMYCRANVEDLRRQ